MGKRKRKGRGREGKFNFQSGGASRGEGATPGFYIYNNFFM